MISLLDNDLYKFTMQNAAMKLYPHSKVKYMFFNRGEDIFPKGFARALRSEIEKFKDVRLNDGEEKYLNERCYFLDPVYIDFLKGFTFNPDEVVITQRGGKLNIVIEGYWYRAILWEVPLLSLISELYFKLSNQSNIDKKNQ